MPHLTDMSLLLICKFLLSVFFSRNHTVSYVRFFLIYTIIPIHVFLSLLSALFYSDVISWCTKDGMQREWSCDSNARLL